ncbi:LysR substrate-binding domain-containing protein (plasmid) [Salipiger sp. H15]|uniref:LysR substrate-binding domain-containing protein n=1 Tax=Alloyangia sp. H15 TaxID=3029062 RepID=A0AAU8ARU4_9RHOB
MDTLHIGSETGTQAAPPLPSRSADARLPNLRHLRALLHVGRLKSVNQAGQFMNLSQPAVTQAIARLERGLGVELFQRHPTGMYASRAGELLLRHVEEMFAVLEIGLAAISRPGREPLPADILLKATQLDALVALTRASTPEGASETLGITPVALNRNLHRLEERLHVTLVLRDGRQLRLSQAGLTLARAAKLAQRELEMAMEEIDEAAGHMRGRLAVGALPLARTYVVPRALITLGQRHASARMQLVEGSYETLLAALRDGDIDILVGTLRQPAPTPDVTEVPLFQDRLCVVGRAGHPLAGKKDLKLLDLLRFPWIAPRMGSPARREFDQIFSEPGHQPPQLFEVASHIAVRAILRESDTLALISRRQIRYEEGDGQLVVLSETLARKDRTIGYTVRSRWSPTRLQQSFLDALDAAQKEGPASVGP